MGKIYEDSPDSDLETVLGERKVPPFSAMDYDGDEPPKLNFDDIPKLTEEEAVAINDPYHGHYQKFIEKMYGITDEDIKKDEEKSHTMDILYQSVEPRFKHFRPPFSIKIFKWEISMMWAYKTVKACLLKDCYPVSMGISSEQKAEESSERTYLENLAEGLKDPMGDSIAEYHGIVNNDQLPEGMEVIHIPQEKAEGQEEVSKEEIDTRINMAIENKKIVKELFQELASDNDEEGDSKELVIEFQCTPVKNVAIDKIAEDLLKQYKKVNKED